jgi:ribosomal protein S18 acetylase RimI-like enzyme
VDIMDSVSLRPINDADLEFLYRVYASTRADEMALTNWESAQVEAFLRVQFFAQHEHYQTRLPPSEFLLIELDGEPIGRIYLGDWDGELRIIDVALLPEHRSQGIGTHLIRQVMQRAAALSKPVTLHVEPYNPALRLYEHLGFTVVEQRGINLFMRWSGE